MGIENNVIRKKDFENRKRIQERENYVDSKKKELSAGYASDISNYVNYCVNSEQGEHLESLLDYLYISILEERVKKTTWEKRLVGIRKYIFVAHGETPSKYFKESVEELRKMYLEEGNEGLRKLDGKVPVEKEMLLGRINKLGTREKAICLVNLITANRPSEMVRLRIQDFDLGGNNVSVYLKKQKEWHNKRITEEVSKAVNDYIRAYGLKKQDYFVGRVYKHGRFEGSQVSETAYREMLKKWVNLSPYNFRKTQVSAMHLAGADLSTIAAQTGHKSLQTLDDHYLKVTNPKVDKYL